MPTELRKSLSNGIYTIQETENPNVLIFYRNDNGILSDSDKEFIVEFYRNFQVIKFLKEDSNESGPSFLHSYDLSLEKSVDEKIIRITNKPSLQSSTETTKKKGFFTKLKEFFK